MRSGVDPSQATHKSRQGVQTHGFGSFHMNRIAFLKCNDIKFHIGYATKINFSPIIT